jgi:hypothetical protein
MNTAPPILAARTMRRGMRSRFGILIFHNWKDDSKKSLKEKILLTP